MLERVKIYEKSFIKVIKYFKVHKLFLFYILGGILMLLIIIYKENKVLIVFNFPLKKAFV